MRRCLACSEPLPGGIPAHWRMHATCWLERYGMQAPAPAPITAARAAEVLELDGDMVRTLIHLAHPDRHDGSAAATRATQWLLSLRGKLESD